MSRQVVNVVLTGSSMKNGVRNEGWSKVYLDDGDTVFLNGSKGFDEVLDSMDKRGVDTRRMRERLDEWVKTGITPPHNEEESIA